MAGLAALGVLAAWLLSTSWRRWPDPVIDFGKELYIPWRLSQGAMLYVDVDDFYGPFSQYFNAALFRVFGPGLMVLVTANLAIFGGIFALLYAGFRRTWGMAAALVAGAVFLALFSFSQGVPVGNYNYATPYAHEATHGMLVVVGLVAILPAWVLRASRVRAAAAGLLFGLAAVIKPEFMLAAGVLIAAAMLLKLRRRVWNRSEIGWLVAMAVLPTMAFAGYFSTRVSWGEAFGMAGRGWLNVVTTTSYTADPAQIRFLGFDRPAENFVVECKATLLALALLGGVALAGWLMSRFRTIAWRFGFLVVSAAGIAWVSNHADWFEAGRCLSGLMLLYLGHVVWGLLRRPLADGLVTGTVLRLAWTLLASVLLSRMLLFGRTFHFGFYQAAIAGMIVPAVMLGDLPTWLRVSGWQRAAVTAGVLALLAPGLHVLVAHSQALLRQRTHPVGTGRDLFYTIAPETEPAGDIVAQTAAWLAHEKKPGQTLIVLPEGIMINYLARMPSPVAPFFFFSSATRGDRETALVQKLAARPPDWVAIISRDLREFGLKRYGQGSDPGAQILGWVRPNYETAVELGGDPLDPDDRGGVILSRK
ncbi:MAG TPA: hypothetical protein VHD32_01765 [Candidatus Didemnitutus sp.]|nr:hypothetical protein [Candidatus Didemnitutus sp.]